MQHHIDGAERLVGLLADCYDDPDLFNSAILGRPAYWSRQREILQSICDYRITVACTGNDIGKGYAIGGGVPWWLCTRFESQIIVTGPSQTVLGSVTWKEIRRACRGSKVPLGIRVSDGIHGSPLRASVLGDWGALGFSTTSVERASGQHNSKLLVIVEEASGVPDEIYDAIDSLNFDRLLLIGNPIRATGRFVDLFRQGEADRRNRVPKHRAVNSIRISTRESPDAHLEKSLRGLADRRFIEDSERRHGKRSLWVRVHIDAEIPSVDAEALLPVEWLDAAAAQLLRAAPPGHPVHKTRRIACDLAEGVGRDSTAIIVRDDWGVLKIIAGNQLGLPEAAHRIAELKREYDVPDERISYDRVGLGRDLPLHLARRGITRAIGYAGEASPRSDDFVNLRTEAAWLLRQRLDPQFETLGAGPGVARVPFRLPPGVLWGRMRDELKVLTYELAGRRTKLMPKDDWKTALGHSPDLGDALIQSFAFA